MADSKRYKEILLQEDAVLSDVIASQAELRSAVNAKDWTNLMKFRNCCRVQAACTCMNQERLKEFALKAPYHLYL